MPYFLKGNTEAQKPWLQLRRHVARQERNRMYPGKQTNQDELKENFLIVDVEVNALSINYILLMHGKN